MKAIAAALLAVFVAALLVYWPGLEGGYFFDDFGQIVLNSAVQPKALSFVEIAKAANSSLSGPTGRPVSMLSFALDNYFFGLDPWAMKFHNVVLHLANTGLIFLLVAMVLRQFACRPTKNSLAHLWAALSIGGIWALHPLNLTAILYVVQRMTSLSAFFSLLGLLAYAWYRTGGRHGGSPRLSLAISLLAVFTVLSVYAKENGLLTPCYAAIMEWFVFRFETASERQKRVLQALFIAAPGLLVLVTLGYFLTHPNWFASAYNFRPFDVWERLMTEGRALALYQSLIVFPNIRAMSLYHDDYVISRSLWDPLTTVPALAWHFGLLALAVGWRKRLPLFAFGICWFYAGHLLESTFFPLELVFEHRNYLPMLGIPVAIYGLLEAVPQHLSTPLFKRCLAGGFIAICGFSTAVRAMDWGDLQVHPLMEAERHPLSPRANFDAGVMLLKTMELDPGSRDALYSRARDYLRTASSLEANTIAPLISLLQLEDLMKRLPDVQSLDELAFRLRERQPNAAAGYNLRRMSDLLNNDEKLFSLGQARTLYDAALANPRLASRDRGVAWVGYGLFEMSRGQDKETGLRYLRRAVGVAPGIVENRIMLAAALIDLKRNEEAQEVLAAAEKLDKYHHFEDQIVNVRSYIVPDGR